jgi:hypothetical protein
MGELERNLEDGRRVPWGSFSIRFVLRGWWRLVVSGGGRYDHYSHNIATLHVETRYRLFLQRLNYGFSSSHLPLPQGLYKSPLFSLLFFTHNGHISLLKWPKYPLCCPRGAWLAKIKSELQAIWIQVYAVEFAKWKYRSTLRFSATLGLTFET